MTDDINISPETEAAIDSNVQWILEVLHDYETRGHVAVKEALERTTDEEKDSLLRVLLMIQAGHVKQLREVIRDQVAASHFDKLNGNGGPTLH